MLERTTISSCLSNQMDCSIKIFLVIFIAVEKVKEENQTKKILPYTFFNLKNQVNTI
jgi:hypothetical protein